MEQYSQEKISFYSAACGDEAFVDSDDNGSCEELLFQHNLFANEKKPLHNHSNYLLLPQEYTHQNELQNQPENCNNNDLICNKLYHYYYDYFESGFNFLYDYLKYDEYLKNFPYRKENSNCKKVQHLFVVNDYLLGRYEGEMKYNKYYGNGVFYGNNDCVYQGNFVDGFPEGKGRYKERMHSGYGSEYEGDFVKGLPEGVGKMKEYCNEILVNYYEGEWKKGKKEGNGCEENYYDNEFYKGDFKNNNRDGKGKLTYELIKDVYEGEFVKNKFKDKKNSCILTKERRACEEECEAKKYKKIDDRNVLEFYLNFLNFVNVL
jgi:hypothetical protein